MYYKNRDYSFYGFFYKAFFFISFLLSNKNYKSMSFNEINFNTYIYKVLKQIHHDIGLTKPAIDELSEGVKAVTLFNQSLSKKNSVRTSRTSRAGLLFSVSRVENIMRDLSIRDRLSFNSAVYLAAVIEYIIAEILELSGNEAKNKGRVRLTTRFIYLGISNDSELSELFKNVYLAGGVLPSA